MATSAHSRKKVAYYYDGEVGNFFYGPTHPMRPIRLSMTHELIVKYGLYKNMQIYRPYRATAAKMVKFHSEEYISFLYSINPTNEKEYKKFKKRFIIKDESDCPIFDGMYKFSQISAGGSIAGAIQLNKGTTDIAINWAGGLHHAKKSEASGFCYINDIVLAILELLKYHQRVLYIDIDIHHGDGVQETFYNTDRVMTVSFHKYAKYFFPETGDLRDIGVGKGKLYSVNVPLNDGIDDSSYESIFVPVITKVIERYQPNAIVLQCGADSLTGDLIGGFNLTIKGHAKCVDFVKKYNLPLLLLGGGGYTIENVARCWTFETAVVLGKELDNKLPNDYDDCFGPDFQLHISPSDVKNMNTRKYLEKIQTRIFENLRMLPCSPGVQMHDIPADAINNDSEPEDEDDSNSNPEKRISIRASDKKVAKDNEFSDSEDEGDERRDERSYKIFNRLKQSNSSNNNNGAVETKCTLNISKGPVTIDDDLEFAMEKLTKLMLKEEVLEVEVLLVDEDVLKVEYPAETESPMDTDEWI